jgi:hypothetical protein
MKSFDVKEIMEQIHISEEMQEEIIVNVQKQMEHGKKRTWNWKKVTTVAAVFVLIAGIISFPVQAVVRDVVKARMENIPKEELQDINDMIQGQDTEADVFSREYSEKERERMEELKQLYENGTFPEKEILQVDRAEAVTEGILCYIKDTGDFYLPDRELTDEELLEIIDFNHRTDYALTQSSAAQEARARHRAEQDRFREQIQAIGGISEQKAIEIAKNQMKSELDASADEKIDLDVLLVDISKADYNHKGNVAYIISFGNPNDKSSYTCQIDSADGNILEAMEHKLNLEN